MFQESLFLAVKLLIAACIVLLVTMVLLSRVACARVVARSEPWTDPAALRRHPARTGRHRLPTGVRDVHPQPR
jgi:hypothetical protein